VSNLKDGDTTVVGQALGKVMNFGSLHASTLMDFLYNNEESQEIIDCAIYVSIWNFFHFSVEITLENGATCILERGRDGIVIDEKLGDGCISETTKCYSFTLE